MQRRGVKVNRLRPVELDPLDEYGLPSKGEKRLLSPKIQETYYAKIAERYLAFCTKAGDRDSLQKQFGRLNLTDKDTAPSPGATTTAPSAVQPFTRIIVPSPTLSLPQNQLSQILSALRKLREAIVASKRRDDFAVQVYLFAIRLGILSGSYETYHPALLYLLRVLHPARNLTNLELREAASYLILDTACRRGDLAEAYKIRHEYRVILRSGSSGGDSKVDGILKALVRDDWVLWRKMNRTVDGYVCRLMEFSDGQMKAHVLKAFGRSYLSVEVDYLEKASLSGWEELREKFGVGWELKDGRVVIRKIQPKK
ncbi:hypothetical protein V8F06_007706 [Rhypophila decipiens]